MLGLSVCESQTQLILRKSDLFLERTIEKMKWQHDALEQVGVGVTTNKSWIEAPS